jgi:hypothetical protein
MDVDRFKRGHSHSVMKGAAIVSCPVGVQRLCSCAEVSPDMPERLGSARTGVFGRSNSIQKNNALLRALSAFVAAIFAAIIVTLSDVIFCCSHHID